MAPSLSVCITTYNMGHVLPSVLANVSDIADEIVVVDNHSTDETPEIVRNHDRTRLIRTRFPGSYAINKNHAIESATGEWILVLDSDELLGDRLRRDIAARLTTRRLDYYKFPRYWVVPGPTPRYVRSETHYPDWQLRLFRNLPHFRYPPEQVIHEHFPRPGRGRGRKLRGRHIFHLDFILNDRARREQKVAERNRMDPISRDINEAYYLYEDVPHELLPCREPLDGADFGALGQMQPSA